MATIQDNYNLILEGKGNKDQFLKQARSLFPQYLTQYLDFNTSVGILKSKSLLSENNVVTEGNSVYDWQKIFEAEVKAEEKKVSKEVEKTDESNFDDEDMKNADNINFNEILKGFYAELNDEKNHGKTSDELKKIVIKNLSKDACYYTENGEFGVKGLGYTKEAPGLGEPKAPKGKYKSSGYGDIDKEVKVKSNVQDSLGDKEAKTSDPKKIKEMDVTPQNSKGVKKMKNPGTEKKIKLKEGLSLAELLAEETNEGKVKDTLFDIFGKYCEDPDDAEKAISDYTERGLDGLSDELVANLTRDEDFLALEGPKAENDADDEFFGDGLLKEEDDSSKIDAIVKKDNSFKAEDLGKIKKEDLDFLYNNVVLGKKNEMNEVSYQMGMNVGSGAGSGVAGGKRFIPTNTLLSKEAFEKINAEGNRRMNFEKPHIKIIRSGENIKLQISQHLLEAIAGAQRGRFTGSALQSKSGTGITSEDLKLISPEFKKLVKTLNEKGKLAKTGEYYLLDVDTKFNPKKNVFMLPLPNQLDKSNLKENEETFEDFVQSHGGNEKALKFQSVEDVEDEIERIREKFDLLDDESIYDEAHSKFKEFYGIDATELYQYFNDQFKEFDKDQEKDKEAEHDFGPDDTDPAGEYGPSSHLEESKSKIVAQWEGPEHFLAKKKESEWDSKDNELYKSLEKKHTNLNESKLRSLISKLIKEELK